MRLANLRYSAGAWLRLSLFACSGLALALAARAPGQGG